MRFNFDQLKNFKKFNIYDELANDFSNLIKKYLADSTVIPKIICQQQQSIKKSNFIKNNNFNLNPITIDYIQYFSKK